MSYKISWLLQPETKRQSSAFMTYIKTFLYSIGSPILHQKRGNTTTTTTASSSPNSSLGKLPTHSSSSVFAMVNSKGYTVSPENSLRRVQQQQQQHHHHQMESSDLGSSIGDDSQRNVLVQALVSLLNMC